MAIYSGFSHRNLCSSIVMLVYQRVKPGRMEDCSRWFTRMNELHRREVSRGFYPQNTRISNMFFFGRGKRWSAMRSQCIWWVQCWTSRHWWHWWWGHCGWSNPSSHSFENMLLNMGCSSYSSIFQKLCSPTIAQNESWAQFVRHSQIPLVIKRGNGKWTIYGWFS